MNRREFMKSGVVSASALAFGNFSFANNEKEYPRVTTRQQRYKEYEQIYKDYRLEINSISFNALQLWTRRNTDYCNPFGVFPSLIALNLAIYGDEFINVNLLKEEDQLYRLDPYRIFRIQTIKGTLLEFQQGDEPDYMATKSPVNKMKCEYIGKHLWFNYYNEGKNIRFHPDEVVHFAIPDPKDPALYPSYGCSLLESILNGESKIPEQLIKNYKMAYFNGMTKIACKLL